MVSRGFTHTNKKFQDSFRKFAGTKDKKAATDQKRDTDDVVFETGTLIKIEKKRMYTGNGWWVDVDGTTYKCSNQMATFIIPESTESNLFYIPIEKTLVDVSLDKKSQIYKILKVHSRNSTIVYSKDGKISIDANTVHDIQSLQLLNGVNSLNLDSGDNADFLSMESNQSKMMLSSDENEGVVLESTSGSITLNVDGIELKGSVKVNNTDLEETIQSLNKRINDLENQVNDLKPKVG